MRQLTGWIRIANLHDQRDQFSERRYLLIVRPVPNEVSFSIAVYTEPIHPGLMTMYGGALQQMSRNCSCSSKMKRSKSAVLSTDLQVGPGQSKMKHSKSVAQRPGKFEMDLGLSRGMIE